MDLDRAILLGIIALLLVLSTMLVLPYFQWVLAALILAFVLRPVQRRLSPKIGETKAAALLVVASSIVIVFPLAGILFFIAGDALQWAQTLQDVDVDWAVVEAPIEEYTGRDVDVGSQVASSAENAAEAAFGGAVSVFETTVHLLIGLGLLLFLLFFFIRDGERLLAWLTDVSPLPETVTDDLIERTDSITRAVLAGHVLVAIIQGMIAGLGLFATGIPNATFWTFVMILLALVPLIGTFVIWAPASLFLYLTGDVALAIGLFVYGAIVVGISDEYLRPVIVDRYAEVSPAIIIVGVVGGISAFGFMGLFVGPILVGALKVAIEVHDEYYEEGVSPIRT